MFNKVCWVNSMALYEVAIWYPCTNQYFDTCSQGVDKEKGNRLKLHLYFASALVTVIIINSIPILKLFAVVT